MGRFKFKLTDMRLLSIGLGGIVILSIIATIFRSHPSGSYNSIHDDQAAGAEALGLWLEGLGYTVKELVEPTLEAKDVDVLFILNPRFEYSSSEARQIRRWVQEGHTLIVAGNSFNINSVLQPYDVSVSYLSSDAFLQSLSSPTLTTPPFSNVDLGGVYGIQSERTDLVVHLFYVRTPVLASFGEGEGTVWVAGTVRPFTNIGLGEDPSASMILNMLAAVPPPAVIGFDEGLHGLGEPPPSLSTWLRTTPAGWSVLSVVALTMTFLVARGRRFGHPIPVPKDQLRREPVEYIQAIANLLRRSGQRPATLAHYRQMLIRELSKRYAIDPHLNDEQMVKLIIARDSSVDGDALLHLLHQLSRKKISEQELVKLTLEIDEWIRGLH